MYEPLVMEGTIHHCDVVDTQETSACGTRHAMQLEVVGCNAEIHQYGA